MTASPTIWPFDGTKMAVLADCHIHPGGGPAFPEALFERLAAEDVDLIVTLGDMGEAAGLDQLAELAPVIGVRGEDDADDPRTDNQYLLLKTGRYDIGCVFSAEAAGLAAATHPFVLSRHAAENGKRVFGVHVDVLLHAGTHKPEEAPFGTGCALNPGSAVLPAEGSKPTFLLMNVTPEGCFGKFVSLG